jgi:hypothetical protein
MSTIMIRDLAQSRDLDRGSMSAVRGGQSLPALMPLTITVQPEIYQSIVLVSDINISALNNIGVIGADFPLLNLNVAPKLAATNRASFGARH